MRKQVCVQLGPGPGLGLSVPLVALGGSMWKGGFGESHPISFLIPGEEMQSSLIHVLVPTPLFMHPDKNMHHNQS